MIVNELLLIIFVENVYLFVEASSCHLNALISKVVVQKGEFDWELERFVFRQQ